MTTAIELSTRELSELRDRFAECAMHSMITEKVDRGEIPVGTAILSYVPDAENLTVAERIATASYTLADAMLRQRIK